MLDINPHVFGVEYVLQRTPWGLYLRDSLPINPKVVDGDFMLLTMGDFLV